VVVTSSGPFTPCPFMPREVRRERFTCVAEPLPGNDSVHCAVRPPSMIQLQPVIDVADGPNKKATKSATSATVMNLFTR
jgi:hypothetical protein